MQEVIDGTAGPFTDLPTDTAEAMATIFGALQKPEVGYVQVTTEMRHQADKIMFRCYLANKHRRRRKKKRKAAKAQRRANRKKRR